MKDEFSILEQESKAKASEKQSIKFTGFFSPYFNLNKFARPNGKWENFETLFYLSFHAFIITFQFYAEILGKIYFFLSKINLSKKVIVSASD